jgi:hypothetical protein
MRLLACLVSSLVVTACIVQQPPHEATTPGSAGADDRAAPPYAYPPEYREPWLDGCTAEGHDEGVCDCVFDRAQWEIPLEDLESEQYDQAVAHRLFAECMLGG